MEEIEYNYFLDELQEKSLRKIFSIFVVILMAIFATFFYIKIHFENNYDYITINGLSMQPTLNAEPVYINGKSVQDGVYIKRGTDADYGDIIIVDKRQDIGKTIIKRLLGKGGDLITIIKLDVGERAEYRFVRIKNGTNNVEVLEENYICGESLNSSGYKRSLGYQEWGAKIDSKYDYESGCNYEELFYLQYFWDSLTNSAKTNNVYRHEITYQGQVYSDVKFYKIEENKIFYMGDNRGESGDARQSGTEYQSKINGKVVSIAHNSTTSRNSFFYILNRITSFFDVLWQEIVEIFAWKA